jgi:hypothetical protein
VRRRIFCQSALQDSVKRSKTAWSHHWECCRVCAHLYCTSFVHWTFICQPEYWV